MDNKDVTIDIIVQDMRYNHYIAVLRKFGIEVYDFDLELMSIVARLMRVENEDSSDLWMELYVKNISKCEDIPMEPLGKNLNPLTEECYCSLLNFSDSNDLLPSTRILAGKKEGQW